MCTNIQKCKLLYGWRTISTSWISTYKNIDTKVNTNLIFIFKATATYTETDDASKNMKIAQNIGKKSGK